jgi:hypothetical protein
MTLAQAAPRPEVGIRGATGRPAAVPPIAAVVAERRGLPSLEMTRLDDVTQPSALCHAGWHRG